MNVFNREQVSFNAYVHVAANLIHKEVGFSLMSYSGQFSAIFANKLIVELGVTLS